MSEFSCPVVQIDDVFEHPNAERLDIARVSGFTVVVGKGEYKKGDLAIYAPPNAIIPLDILDLMGLTGKLAGPDKNRVKPMRLRGILSEGILIKPPFLLEEKIIGWDFSRQLGIVKYEPPIPPHMQGELMPASGLVIPYDVENIKKYPDPYPDNCYVYVTEKIHGTFCQIGFNNRLIGNADFYNGGYVASKGLGAKGFIFKNSENNKDNLYVRVARPIIDRLRNFGSNIIVLGEIYGNKVQDLQYDLPSGKVDFRVFGAYIEVNQGVFNRLTFADTEHIAKILCLNMVPVIAAGLWRNLKDRIYELASGQSYIATHIREGAVIHPKDLSFSPLKVVSEAYLFRGGNPTEYN